MIDPRAKEDGETPGPAIRTMADFAQLTGLSRPTISKYFDDPDSVRPSTRRRIEEALRRHDFRPNFFAMNLNRKRPKIIGMIVPDLADPFYVRLVQVVETLSNAAGIFPLILSAHGQARLEAHAADTLLSLKVAGALVAPLGWSSEAAVFDRLRARIPLVFLDARLELDVPFVGTDNEQSVPQIVDYLCETGDRPAFFEGPPVNHNVTERRDAYVAAMERLGLQPECIAVPPARDWGFETVGFTVAQKVLAGPGFPTRTILCANDRIAVGVLAAVSQHGLRTGKDREADLRIAGHDDQPLSRYTCPPLTTVAQDVEQLAERGLGLLLRCIAQDDVPGEQLRLGTQLVIRDSA